MRLPVALLAGIGTICVGTVAAHHSFLGEFDGTRALRLRGVVASVEMINPHSFIYLDVEAAEGGVERWALEGPSAFILQRRGWDRDIVKAGDSLGVCGYASRRDGGGRRTEPVTGRAARMLSAAVLILPGGEERLWENYRQGKCGLDR
jgi:hypothetical protein